MSEERGQYFPAAVEFSPGIIELGEVLQVVAENAGDWDATVEAVRARYFSESAMSRADSEERHGQQLQRARNVLWGMGPNGYQLLSLEDATLTPEGQQLLEAQDDGVRHEVLAAHILTRLNGMTLLQAIRDLQARGDRITKSSLHRELERHGIDLPRATTYHQRAVAWLRKAGVISEVGYEIDEEAVQRLTGMSTEEVEEWSSLTPGQAAFLRTLRRMVEVRGSQELPVKPVVDQSVYEHGRVFRPDQIRAEVTRPLEEAGYIEVTTASTGRGGKSGVVKATEKLLNVNLELVTDFSGVGIPPDLRPLLNTPLDQIHQNLGDTDRNIRGIALELLALRLAIDLGLMPLRFRERSNKTGGAEVDLLADAVHLHYSRWLFQCKNTKTVDLPDLAKEIGMATMLNGHVVVMVTTGRFASSVQTYAEEVMRTTPLQVVLVDGSALRKYRQSGSLSLMGYFHDVAGEVMGLKRSQVTDLNE